MAKKNIEVIIAGETIKLRANEDPQYVQALAKELDDMINDGLVKGTSKLKAAVMIALDLLNENRKMKVLISELQD